AHLPLDPSLGSLRTVMRPPALLRHPSIAPALVAPPPLIARGARDSKFCTQPRKRFFLAAGGNHESHPLFFHIHAAPGHPFAPFGAFSLSSPALVPAGV